MSMGSAVYAIITILSVLVACNNFFLIGGKYFDRPINHQSPRKSPRDHRRRGDGTYRERMLNSQYARYLPSALTQQNNSQSPMLLQETDSIYRLSWMSPFVLEEQRLIFFTVPKVACTVFKQLFRRMKGYPNWKKHNNDLPHKQQVNGLKLLSDYPLDVANEMLTNDTWTRAIFVRDPKERLLSAYLDKGIKAPLMNRWCCKETQECGEISAKSFEGFLSIVPTCLNNHWEAQAHRMENKFWFVINFVGHVESAAADTRRLLNIIDDGDYDIDTLWNKYGANGWGDNGTEHIFQYTSSIRHGTGSSEKLEKYYTADIDAKVEEILQIDYEHPLFNFALHT